MLQGSSSTVSKDMANSSEKENQRACDTLRSIDVSNNKGSQEGDEKEATPQKLSKLSDEPKEEGMKTVMAFLILPQDQENEQIHEAEISDETLRIGKLYKDLSVYVLQKVSRSDYGLISQLNSGFRSLVRSGELYKARREMGIVEHWIYFSCNLGQWEGYDPSRGRWMKLPEMPRDDCFMCSDKESLSVGTDILVFGKAITAPVVYGYSLLTNTWSYAVEMNIPRFLFASASVGGIAILAGGVDPKGNVLSVAELYNSETRKWETLPNMHTKRRMSAGVFMDGKFYVIGGIAENNITEVTSGEEYDLETKTWRVIPDMFPPRGGVPQSEAPPLVAVVNNVLYAADVKKHIVKRYVKETNKWVTIGSLPEKTSSTGGWGIGFRACGNRIMVIGGPRDESGAGMTEINSWIPAEGPVQWDLLAKRRIGSFVINCAVMGC